MNAKTTRVLSTILMGIPALVLIIGGISKILHAEPEPIMQFLKQSGFGNHVLELGLTELLIVSLLLYPKSNKIGFLLASCYFGGALCLELGSRHFSAAGIFLSLLWISM